MDANAEGGPPKASVAEVDVEVEAEKIPSSPGQPAQPTSPLAQPVLEPLSSNDIFRNVFRPPPPPSSQQPQPHPQPLEQPTTGTGVQDGDHVQGSDNSAKLASPRPVQIPVTQGLTPEEQQKYNEEEFQRRLKGEYEAAQQRLGDVVSGNMSRPLRLTSIRLSPAPPITRPSFLSSLISPFLTSPPTWKPDWLHPSPGTPRTLHEILLTTRSLIAHLERFGVFDMERSGVRLQPVRGGDPDEVELVLGLRERGRLFLKAGTEVGGGEGGGNVTARVRNALGGAETLELNASIGTKTKSAYEVSLSTPVLASPLLSFALQGFSFDRDNSAFASHREEARGARAKFSAIAPWGTHDLTYEYIQRSIGRLTPGASVSVRELAHPTTKSSISHTWTSDTRDDAWAGTRGRLLKLSNEYAGLPGSSTAAHFFKTVFSSQLSRAIYPGSDIRFSLSSFTSALFPLFASTPTTPDSHPPITPLPDRVFLGGPNSVRGWKVGGMGMRDGNDSLGGDLAWALGLSVLAPIPKKEHWGLKLHGFMNVGKVVGYRRDAGWMGNVERLYKNPNVSVGVGLMYRLEPIRIEVNFAMPLVGRKGERTSRGLGIGVGIEFL